MERQRPPLIGVVFCVRQKSEAKGLRVRLEGMGSTNRWQFQTSMSRVGFNFDGHMRQADGFSPLSSPEAVSSPAPSHGSAQSTVSLRPRRSTKLPLRSSPFPEPPPSPPLKLVLTLQMTSPPRRVRLGANGGDPRYGIGGGGSCRRAL